MKHIPTTLVVLFLFAAPAFADYLRISPPAPDSTDEVIAEMGGIWSDGCIPRNPQVMRNASEIRIILTAGGEVCTLALAPWEQRVSLGRLEPGAYTIQLFIHPFLGDPSPTPFLTLRFPVTNAEARFTLTPSVAPSSPGGVEVFVRGEFGSCPFVPPCFLPQIIFGGTAALSVREVVGGVIATTPSHAPGIVDVEIRGRANTSLAVLPGAFTFSGLGVPDAAAYTPVLIPLFFSGPGAFGAEWVTEASTYHEGDVPVWALNAAQVTCLPNVSPCPQPAFPSKSAFKFAQGSQWKQGLILYVPRSQADELHFSLHVRDVSRSAETAGTELPVVREEDLQTSAIHLLNVPVEGGFRHTLRIYDVALNYGGNVFVAAYSMTTKQLLGERFLTLAGESPCLGGPVGCTPVVPAYAELNDLRSAFNIPAGTSEVRLHIRASTPGTRLWAFVSVTNNATQEITTIQPQ